jgi:hypothetical protein
MNGKNPCKRNMMLSSRMGHVSWWILHLEQNLSVGSGYSRKSIDQMVHEARLMEKGFTQK